MSETDSPKPSIDPKNASMNEGLERPTVTLITGATGFIGNHLVSALAGDPDSAWLDGLAMPTSTQARKIHILTSRAAATFEGVDPAAVTVHVVDLMDSSAVDAIFAEIQPTELFHLAWFNGESGNRYSDAANFDWVAITEHLVEAFARNGGTRAILAGSCIEYGPAGGVLREDSPVDPETVYGRCKLDAAERTLAVAADYPNLSVAIARIFFVLGRNEDRARLVPHIINQLLKNEPAELSSGAQRRDYIHAWDVARGMVAIADSRLIGFVNIGMGSSISVKELSQRVGDAVGRPDLLWFGSRAGGADTAEEITADITRLTTATDWRPSLDLEAASADVVKWWRSNLGASS